jgi:hypothetical protein
MNNKLSNLVYNNVYDYVMQLINVPVLFQCREQSNFPFEGTAWPEFRIATRTQVRNMIFDELCEHYNV